MTARPNLGIPLSGMVCQPASHQFESNRGTWVLGNLGVASGAVFTDGDLDSDGAVTLVDLSRLQGNLGQSLPSPSASHASVPEPSSLLLAVVAFSLLLIRRRAMCSPAF